MTMCPLHEALGAWGGGENLFQRTFALKRIRAERDVGSSGWKPTGVRSRRETP